MRPTLNSGCIRMLIARQCTVAPKVDTWMCSCAFAASLVKLRYFNSSASLA